MPDPAAHEHSAAALFIVINALFMKGLGILCRSRWCSNYIVFNAVTLAAAHELFSCCCQSSDLDNAAELVLGRAPCAISAKPSTLHSVVHRWITDPFWWDDPEFKLNLHMSHGTFLHIVKSLEGSLRDSVNPLTGQVRVMKEFKVAVGLYHLGHGGTWQSTSNVCGIGISTSRSYVKLFVAAVVAVLKPLNMPGKPCAD